MSHARRYAICPEPRSRSRSLKGSRPSVPHGTNFYFLKRSLKIPSEITFETTETNWVCMIVFLCAHVRISISTYILTSIVIYLPCLHQVTPLGVVFLFMLVNWWVEKHQRFLFNVNKRFLFWSRFFTFLTFFIFFFWNVFTSMTSL